MTVDNILHVRCILQAPCVCGNQYDPLSFSLQTGSSEYCHQAVLTLTTVTESDQGEYVFLVRSPRGLAEGTVTLNVTRASSFSVAAARAHHVTATAAATAIYILSAWLVATNLS